MISFLQWCETQRDCNRLRLIDILVRPMQRLTKYSLLLKAVLKKTDDVSQKKDLAEMVSHPSHPQDNGGDKNNSELKTILGQKCGVTGQGRQQPHETETGAGETEKYHRQDRLLRAYCEWTHRGDRDFTLLTFRKPKMMNCKACWPQRLISTSHPPCQGALWVRGGIYWWRETSKWRRVPPLRLTSTASSSPTCCLSARTSPRRESGSGWSGSPTLWTGQQGEYLENIDTQYWHKIAAKIITFSYFLLNHSILRQNIDSWVSSVSLCLGSWHCDLYPE